MLATFTVREDINETNDFHADGDCLPLSLFHFLAEGRLHAFRVDTVEGRLQVTISGDTDEDNSLASLIIAYSDGPDSVEYHISP